MHTLEEMAIEHSCLSPEPGVSVVVATRQSPTAPVFGELATRAWSTDPASDRRVHLGAVETEHLLRAWAADLDAGRNPAPLWVHEGLVRVIPTQRIPFTTMAPEDEGVPLCHCVEDALDGGGTLIQWRAEIADAHAFEPDAAQAAKVEQHLAPLFPLDQTHRAAEGPWRLLAHLRVGQGDAELGQRLRAAGDLGGMGLADPVGATRELAYLRMLASLAPDASEGLALALEARAIAARWARELWPDTCGCGCLDRATHRESLGLAHLLEGGVLALHLYPRIPIRRLNRATAALMRLLTDGVWAQDVQAPGAEVEIVKDAFATLPREAWPVLARECESFLGESEQSLWWTTFRAVAGEGARAPHARDLTRAIPRHAPLDAGSRQLIATTAAQALTAHMAGHVPADPVWAWVCARGLVSDA